MLQDLKSKHEVYENRNRSSSKFGCEQVLDKYIFTGHIYLYITRKIFYICIRIYLYIHVTYKSVLSVLVSGFICAIDLECNRAW